MATRPTEEEELYFQELELERRRKLRKQLDTAAVELQSRRGIADAVDTTDLDVAQRIKMLGFDGDSARVFDLLPLVHVAWADGKIQRAERAQILGLLEARKITPGTEAFTLIESLLEDRPSATYMEESLALLRQIVRINDDRAREVVDLCVAIADASGGFLGLGNRISDDEREQIEMIANNLGSAAQREFKSKLGG